MAAHGPLTAAPEKPASKRHADAQAATVADPAAPNCSTNRA
jgi:hypothetical protein